MLDYNTVSNFVNTKNYHDFINSFSRGEVPSVSNECN